MVEEAPSSIDLSEFQFKLQSHLKIFSSTKKYNSSTNLLAAASRFGLVFVGTPNSTLHVIQLKTIESVDSAKSSLTNYPSRIISLPTPCSHVSLNSDQTLLAVTVQKNKCPVSMIYDVQSFLAENIHMVQEIRLSATPNISVLQSDWNPAIASVYTACKSDGSLGIYSITENSVDINEIPTAAKAKCFCWSPKGKQVVVGSQFGTLTQYKPDLKAVKAIPTPSISGMSSPCVLNVFWLTNYQFVAVYKDGANDDAKPAVFIVNAPKTGAVSYINYDDVCYSYSTFRPPQYYIIHQQNWGVLLLASSNSAEVTVLGVFQQGEPVKWQQWNQLDAARAELPLSENNEETYPVGFAFDTASQLHISVGENQKLPPMPMIHILSSEGVLSTFNVINVRQGAAQVCSPPEEIADQSGLSQFIPQTSSTVTTPSPPEHLQSSPAATASAEQTSNTMQISMNQLATTVATATTTVEQNLLANSQNSAFPTMFGGTSQALLGSASGFLPANQVPTTTTSTSGPNLFFSKSSTPSIPMLGASTALFSTATSTAFSHSNLFPSNSLPLFPVTTISFLTTTNTTLSPGLQNPVSNLAGTSPASITAMSTTPSNLGLSVSTNPTAAFEYATTVTSLKNSNSGFPLSFASKAQIGNLQNAHTVPQKYTTSTVQMKSNPNSVPMNVTSKSVTYSSSSLSVNAAALRNPTQPLLATPKESNLNSFQKHEISLASKSNQSTYTKDSCTNEYGIQDALLQKNATEEVKNFGLELEVLLKKCRSIDINVGSNEEKNNLVDATEEFLDFYSELKETTDSQKAEVDQLRRLLWQAYAWYEESNIRHRRFADPQLEYILLDHDVDPVSEKQLADIKHLTYYIDSQLKQIDGFLDHQWAAFQDSCKKQIKGRLKVPLLEPIYQTLVRQSAIIEKQKYLLKDIKARIKVRNSKLERYPHVLNINLSTKSPASLEEEMCNLNVSDINMYKSKLNILTAEYQSYTQNKESSLCSYFSNRSVTRVVPKKTKLIDSPVSTPSKLISNLSTFSTPPTVQRSLTEKFDCIAQSNSQLDTQNSTQNLSFTDKKFHTSEKVTSTSESVPKVNSSCNLPHQSMQQIATIIPIEPQATNLNASTPIAKSDLPLFGNTPPAFNFGLGTSNMPFTAEKLSPSKSNVYTNITTLTPKINESKILESSFATTQVQPRFIKPNTDVKLFGQSNTLDVKTSQPTLFVPSQSKANLPLAPATIFKVPIETGIKSKESLDSSTPFVNFSNNLDPGKQSTPKPKASINFSASQNNISFTPTTNSVGQAASAKPHSLIPSTVTKSAVTASQFPLSAYMVPSSTVAVSITSSSVSSTNITSASDKITPVAPLTITTTQSTPTSTFIKTVTPSSNADMTTTTASIFSGKTLTDTNTSTFVQFTSSSNNSSTENMFKEVASNNNLIFGVQSTASTTTNSSSHASIFSPAANSNITIFGGKPISQPTNVEFGQKSSTAATTISFSFTTASLSVSTAETTKPNTLLTTTTTTTPTTIFAKTAVTTHSTVFTTVTIPSTVSNIISTPNTVASSTSEKEICTTKTVTSGVGFDLLNTPTTGFAAVTESAVVFAATTTSNTGFGVTTTATSMLGVPITTSTTTGFSFMQAATGVLANATTTSVLSLPTTAAALVTNTTTAMFSNTQTTQEPSSFGFDSLSTPNNSGCVFGMSNMVAPTLVSIGSTTNTTSSVALPNTFSFATPSTSNISGSGTNFSFSNNLFSKPATTTTASTFMGQSICSPSFTQTSSIFGQSSGNIFTQKPADTNTSAASLFGKSSGSIFGGNATITTTTTPSLFGQNTGSLFGSTNTTTTSSIFPKSSLFSTNTATSTSSIFSPSKFTVSTATTSNNFSFTSTNNMFGAKPVFGQPATFGQAPAFGSSSTFGSPTTRTGTFGSWTSSPTQNTGTFSGFGSPPTFGQQPAFGAPPAFGQSTFGTPATFGGQPAFGSQQKLFGSSSSTTTGTFASNMDKNSTFANLANQSTLGFGSLAQNQGATSAPQPPQFAGGSQFTSWR